jgi:eukaryotic translation initiation factor 2C
VDEDSQARRCTPIERVERMFEKVKANLPGPPEFLLCVLPERKNCDIYGNMLKQLIYFALMNSSRLHITYSFYHSKGPWKKKNLHEMGIVTQCVVPSNKMNDQYFTNVLLKINAKVWILISLPDRAS